MIWLTKSRWNHYSNECLGNIHDDLLRAETGVGDVTKVFQVSLHGEKRGELKLTENTTVH